MPPKKDSKKKEEPKPEDDGAERELVEKELVIGYLKSKLGRYQDHGDKLQTDNLKLTDELETQKLNLRDINEFLTNELKARSLTTSALEAKVYELNQLIDENRKGHEAALNKLAADKDKELEAQAQVISEFEKKAKLVQDFLDQKESMEKELANLKSELAAKIKDYEYRLTDVDRSHIQDREKWKRETAQKIKETKIQMMKLTDNQLEMTTKRTIMENEQMSIELTYQSRQTEKLMTKNSVLGEENADLRRQLVLARQTEEELARRNSVYQKTIKSLLQKLQQQGSERAEAGGVVREIEEHASNLESSLHLARLQLEEAQHQVDVLTGRLEERTQELESATSQYDDVAKFLVQCMEEVREKIVTVVSTEPVPQHAPLLPSISQIQRPGSGQGSTVGSIGGATSVGGGLLMDAGMMPQTEVTVLPGRLDELNSEQRERVLAYLLEKLHVYTHTRAAAGGSGGGSGGVALPPIPAYPRRQPAVTNPVNQTLLAVPAPQQVLLPPGGMPGSAALGASWPQPATSASVSSTRGSGRSRPAGVTYPPPLQIQSASPQAQAQAPLVGQQPQPQLQPELAGMGPGSDQVAEGQQAPGVEELLGKVMSDVRPWGKRAPDSPVVAGGSGGGLGASSNGVRGSVFIKRGPATTSSSNSRNKLK